MYKYELLSNNQGMSDNFKMHYMLAVQVWALNNSAKSLIFGPSASYLQHFLHCSRRFKEDYNGVKLINYGNPI